MAESTYPPSTEAPTAARYVYEAPVRIWHWTHALSIVVLCVTGYLIANPLTSISGEASDHFVMGYMRLVHFIAAYVFTIGFLVRIYWAIVGNRYARELFIAPVWRGAWWQGLWHEVRYYLFLTREPRDVAGHNELAQAAMWVFNVAVVLVVIFTGFALYGEGLGAGSWADRLFGWVIPAIGNAQETRMWHLLCMWLLVTFAVIHIYMVVRADVMGRQSSVSTIISGWRMSRPGRVARADED
jgi:Ni/Fe-hydrogenase 1 B-type cytochrome subunit